MRTALACPEPPDDDTRVTAGAIAATPYSRAVASTTQVVTGVITAASIARGVITSAHVTTYTIGGTHRLQEA